MLNREYCRDLNSERQSCHRAKSSHLWGIAKSSSTRLFIVTLKFIFNLPLRASHKHRRHVHASLQTTWSGAQSTAGGTTLTWTPLENEFDAESMQLPSDVCPKRQKVYLELIWCEWERRSFTDWNGHNNQLANYLKNETCAATGRKCCYDLPCDGQKAFLRNVNL